MDMDFDVFKEKDIHMIEDMCDKFIVSDLSQACLQNQLIRGEINSDNSLGHRTYREAKDRWRTLNKNDL